MLRLASAAVLLATCAILSAACQDDTLVEVPDPPRRADPPPPDPVDDPPPDDPAPPDTSGQDCSDDSDCGDDSECASGTCVGVGVLQVTLTFPVDADFDLHVVTPSGEEIFYANPSADGGVLDVDQCIVSCGPGEHVENIFFNGALLSGTYETWAVNFDGRDGGQFTIDVSGAATASLTGLLDPFPDAETEPLEFTTP
jgi:hypothetical protein